MAGAVFNRYDRDRGYCYSAEGAATFDPIFPYLRRIGGPDSAGRVWVSGMAYSLPALWVMNRQGRVESQFNPTGMSGPLDLAYDAELAAFWVTDDGTKRLFKIGLDGEVLASVALVLRPVGLYLDPSTLDLYVIVATPASPPDFYVLSIERGIGIEAILATSTLETSALASLVDTGLAADATYVYGADHGRTDSVLRWDRATLTSSPLALTTPSTFGISALLAEGANLWVGRSNVYLGVGAPELWQVDPATGNLINSVAFNPSDKGVVQIKSAGSYLYVAIQAQPGAVTRVLKLDPATLATVGTFVYGDGVSGTIVGIGTIG